MSTKAGAIQLIQAQTIQGVVVVGGGRRGGLQSGEVAVGVVAVQPVVGTGQGLRGQSALAVDLPGFIDAVAIPLTEQQTIGR